jgi:hypothetical protein
LGGCGSLWRVKWIRGFGPGKRRSGNGRFEEP